MSDEDKSFWKGLPDDIKPLDEETQDEWLDRLFPQAADNTVDWLCYCMSPYQSAIAYCMIELNMQDMNEDKQGVYRQRLQRLWKAMLQADNAETIKQYIESARKFVEEHQIH